MEQVKQKPREVVVPNREVWPAPAEKTLRSVQKSKESIAGFFKINIHDIFNSQPVLIGESLVDGRPAEKFVTKLSTRELSTFCAVEIVRFKGGDCLLTFLSDHINDVHDELKELIDFCLATYGPDFMKKGSFCEEDYRDIRLGIFSRVWHDTIRIENLNFALTLTLYHISQQ
jgi:hypothetical protein